MKEERKKEKVTTFDEKTTAKPHQLPLRTLSLASFSFSTRSVLSSSLFFTSQKGGHSASIEVHSSTIRKEIKNT